MSGRDFLVRAAVILILGAAAAAGLVVQKPGTEGETAASGAAETAVSVWFCPGLQPRQGRTEIISLANPGTETVGGRLSLLGEGKTLKTRPIEIPALDNRSIDVGLELSPSPPPAVITDSQSAGVVAVLELDGPASVGAASHIASGAITDVATARCVDSVSERFYVAGGSSVRGAETDLFLANPLGYDAVSNISLLTEKGIDEPPKLQRLPVLASGQATFRISEESRRRWVINARSNNTSGEIAGLLEVSSDGTRIPAGVARLAGNEEASAAWIFPAYSANDGAGSMLSISNPDPETRKVEIRIVPDMAVSPTVSQAVRSFTREIPGESAITLTPSPRLGEGSRFGVAVEAPDGKPILAFATVGSSSSRGLGITAGEPRPATGWVLHDADALGLPAGYRLVVSIMNVADRDATVRLSAFGNGTVSRPAGLEAIKIERGRETTVDVGSMQLPPGVRSLRIDSDVPIVAEATVESGLQGGPLGFDVLGLHPVRPDRPSPGTVSSAGIGLPGGASTAVFVIAFIGAALLVFALSRGRPEKTGFSTSAQRSLREEAILAIASDPERRARPASDADRANHVFVLFSHEGCRACMAVKELIESVVEGSGGSLVEVCYEKERAPFDAAGVEDVPTTVLVFDGRIEEVWVGPLERRAVTEALDRCQIANRGPANSNTP